MKSDYNYERKQNGDRLIIRWYLNKHYIAKRCRFLCGIIISMTAPEEDFFLPETCMYICRLLCMN